MTYAPARPRSRAPWIAILLTPLLALASVLVPASAATAASEYGITVTPTGGLASGDTVEITGRFPASVTLDTGDQAGSALATGVYLMFCDQPSGAAGTAAGRATGCDTGKQQYLSSVPMHGMPATGTVTDGTWTFTVTMVVEAGAGKGVFVRLYHGFSPANLANPYVFDQFVPLSFAPEVPEVPETPAYGFEVSPTSDLNDGDTVTVTGTLPATITSLTGTELTTGLYIMYCDQPAVPVGTAGGRASGTACDSSQQKFITAAPLYGMPATGTVTDGVWTFSVDITVDADSGKGIFTRLYHGFTAANVADPYAWDTFTPLDYEADDAEQPGTQEPGTTPGITPPALTAGSLSWGIKSAFRSYVTGPVALGTITTSGVTTVLGDFVFPQAGSAQFTQGVGSAAYSGSVRFMGHHGELDLRFSDPQVRVDSTTSGTLLLRVNGGAHVAFANLALASGTTTTDATGAVRYAHVPATLTAAGARGFAGFYSAGTALDPVSFVVGAAGRSTAGAMLVASAGVPAGNTPDATPPATDGITIADGELVEGGEVTAEAEGFQPNETGILVVIYSEPTVLADDLTADAAGRVSWTGALPRGLSGTHTLTFQGSVDRGIVLDIAAANELPCTVSDASLVWGFKENFRAYIDGSIANGEWTTDGEASYATPVFTWANGSGGADDDALDVQFSGSVRFTGHGGVLDTTIANPRVVIDGDRAVLLLDVHGTTQAGDPVEQTGVEFAELDLDGATRTDDGELRTLADVPATLTAAGAAAFGTYPEGEALDPLTITETVEGGCATAVEPSAAPPDDELETDTATDAGWPGWATVLIIALLAAAILATIVVVLVRRRRA